MTKLWIKNLHALDAELEEYMRLITTEDRQFPGYHGGSNPPKRNQNRERLRPGSFPEHVTHDDNNKNIPHGRILEHYEQPRASNYQKC